MTAFNDRRTNHRARSDAMAPSPRGETRGFQIGPRIRIGGDVGKIGQKVKIGAGKLAKNPLVDAAAGAVFGPEASAALGAAGRALDTSGGGLHGGQGLLDLAKGGAEGFASGYAGSKLKNLVLAGAKHFGGDAALAGASRMAGRQTPQVDNNGMPITTGADDMQLDDNGMPITGGDGGDGADGGDSGGFFGTVKHLGGDLLGGAEKLLGGGPGGSTSDLLKHLLGIAGVADAAYSRKQQQDQYNKLQPIRDRGMSLLTGGATPPNLSPIFGHGANPYAAAYPTLGTSVPIPSSSPLARPAPTATPVTPPVSSGGY